MNKRNTGRIAGVLGVAAAAAWAIVAVPATLPAAASDPCSDAELVFARGTGEAPGLGTTGTAFVDALRAQTGAKSLNVYPVDYPADRDFANSIAAGVDDATSRVQSIAATCPNTRIVLGGFSQGAAVVDTITGTLPPEVANHVAAVAVFGNPRSNYARSMVGGPLPVISPQFSAKTIDMCLPDDAICSEGKNPFAHDMYVFTQVPAEAATFVVGRL